MRIFKDSEGREWSISVTVGSIRRVMDLTGHNIAEMHDQPEDGEPSLLVRLTTKPMLFVDVLFALCKPQCDEREMSDEAFGEALSGEAYKAAFDAFWEECSNFFQGLGRTEIKTMIDKSREVVGLAISKATVEIGTLDAEKAAGSCVGNLPDSLVSTPQD